MKLVVLASVALIAAAPAFAQSAYPQFRQQFRHDQRDAARRQSECG